MSSTRPRVFVTCKDIPPEALQLLQQKCEVCFCSDYDPTKEEVHRMVRGVDALCWFWLPSTVVDKTLLEAAGPQLKVISLMSSGYEHLDLQEIARRGIRVGYAPHIQDAAVADMAVTLLLAVVHRIQEGREKVIIGKWHAFQQNFLGYEICESTVGIVGLGNIGQAIAKRLKAFEVKRLLYYGPSKKQEAEDYGAEYVCFDELLQQCDYVIVCCRLDSATRNMFNDAAFDKMKPNSVIINVGRGQVVDHGALERALEKGKIWGAGLDVMTPEPLPPESPLLKYNNVVVTPHVGSATVKTRGQVAIRAVENILAALEGNPMPSELKIS